MWESYDFSQICERKPAVDGVDAHGALPDAGWCGLIESSPHEGARFGFLMRGDTVFEIVGDTVGC
jgi:hypothetical protein